jgi:DNA-binding response OmpR family regulator
MSLVSETLPPADLMPVSLRVVVVEDHPALLELICDSLSQNNCQVTGVSCAEDVDQICTTQPTDVFVVDLNLPGEDGLSLTRRLRASNPLVGIILLTARSEVHDRVAGYESGADIYIVKPVSEQELMASVRAVARKKKSHEQVIASMRSDPLVLDRTSLKLMGVQGEPIRLSFAEATVLAALAKAPGQRLEVWQIIANLGLKADSYSRSTLAVRMTRLRKKLVLAGAPEDCLEALRNEGYQLCVAVSVL